MQKEYSNRQNMHLTVIKLIDTAEHEAAWKDQKLRRTPKFGPGVKL